MTFYFGIVTIFYTYIFLLQLNNNCMAKQIFCSRQLRITILMYQNVIVLIFQKIYIVISVHVYCCSLSQLQKKPHKYPLKID